MTMANDYFYELEKEDHDGRLRAFSRTTYLFDFARTRPESEDVNLWLNVIARQLERPRTKNQEAWKNRFDQLKKRALKNDITYQRMESNRYRQALDGLVGAYRSYFWANSFNPHRKGMPDERLLGDRRHKRIGNDGDAGSPAFDFMETIIGGDVNWSQHQRMVESILDPNAQFSGYSGDRYLPALLGDRFGIKANPLSRCAEAFYLLKLSALSAGTKRADSLSAIKILDSLDEGNRRQVDLEAPGLIDSLLAIAHGQAGNETQSRKYREKAVARDAQWASFVDEHIVLWDKVGDE